MLIDKSSLLYCMFTHTPQGFSSCRDPVALVLEDDFILDKEVLMGRSFADTVMERLEATPRCDALTFYCCTMVIVGVLSSDPCRK